MPDLFVQRTAGQVVARQLGQSTPAITTAASLYTPGDGVETIVKTVVVANVTTSVAAFSIFHDDDGTTYDDTTALFKAIPIPGQHTDLIEVELSIGSSGNLAVKTDTTAALTFSLYGEEVQVRAR
jgi:hypothetical protein